MAFLQETAKNAHNFETKYKYPKIRRLIIVDYNQKADYKADANLPQMLQIFKSTKIFDKFLFLDGGFELFQ